MSVDNFLEQLQAMSPSQKKKTTFVKRRTIEKIFCGHVSNHGKYQMLPINSVITGNPFVVLANTREIAMPRKNMSQDGQEQVYTAWIRILPSSAYDIVDPSSGQVVSPLTAEEIRLHTTAINLWEELYKELDAYNNRTDPNITGFIRRKNYTIWNSYTLNKWKVGETRNPERSNFSALFVVTAKNFIDILTSNVQETNLTSGMGNSDWTSEIYNRDTCNRKGYIMFSISKNEGGPGFNISTTHTLGAGNYLSNVVIPEEDMELMQNPVEEFLGWQAARDEENPAESRHLFNSSLYNEVIQYMTDQLAQIRITKQSGGDTGEAIKATNDMVVQSQHPTDTRGQATNDPILAKMAAEKNAATAAQAGTYGNTVNAMNPGDVMKKNTDPFNNPPAAHIDPVSGTPVNNFQRPSFAMGNSGDDMPF